MDRRPGEEARRRADESLLIVAMLSLDFRMHEYRLFEIREEEK
jgi:hypothetical protein